MCECNEIIVVDKESIDTSDPHGYFCDFRRPVLNFKSPTKRSFLNECIRQIYILNGDAMPTLPNTAVYNRYQIWNALNAILEPPKISHYQAAVERVKRRLFRDTKLRSRKNKDVFRNIITETECFYYKHQRSELGVRKIRRKYLDEVRERIDAEMRQELKRKRVEYEDISDDDVDDNHNEDNDNANYAYPDYRMPLYCSTVDGVYEMSQHVIDRLNRCHGNMARHQPQRERCMEEQLRRERNTEACRLSSKARKLEEVMMEQQYQQRIYANEKALEASIRSILYMKALMGLMVNGSQQQQQGNFYA